MQLLLPAMLFINYIFLKILGLYTVEKFWSCVGLSGFLVWKYILKRVPNQAPPPWLEKKEDDSSQVAFS